MLANRKAKLDWATECQTPLDETRISMFKMNNSTNSNINANTSSNPNTSPSSSFPSSSASASASTSASASSSSSSLSTTTASNNTAIAPSSSSVSTDPATATATTTLNKDSSEKDQHPLLFHPQPPHLHQQRQQQQQQQQLRGQPHNMYYPTSADPAIASMGVGVGSVGMGALHPNTNPSLTSNPNLQSSHSSAQQQHLQQQQQQQSLQQQSQQQQQQQQQQSFIQNSPLPPGAPLPYPHHFFNNMNMGINPDVYAATVAMQQQLGLVGVGGAGVSLLSTSPHTHGHGHSHGHGHIHNMAGTAATSPAGQHQPNSGFPNPALASMTLGMQGMGINGLPTIAGLTGGLNGMGSLNVNALGVGANPNLVPSLAALGLSPSPHPTGHPINLNHLNVNHSGHPHLHHNPHGIAPPPPPISPSSVGGPPSATSTGPGMGMPGGPSANNRKLGLYKTELCRSWEEKGSCRYGPKCQFAHGEDELRKVSRHPKYKTEICRTFWVSGSCPYGKRCCFIHTELPPSPADGVPPPSSGPSTANPTPVTNSSGPTSPVRNKSMGELNDTHPNGVSEQQQQQLSLLTRLNNNVNNGIPTSASAPVTASSTPASASPAPGQNTNVAIPSSQLATPTTEGSVTPTSAYPKNNDFSSDSEVSSHLASSGAGTTPTGRASRPTFLRVDTHINTSVSMKQNKSAFPIMNPNTLTSLALGGMSMGGGGSGISGAGNNSSSNNNGGSRLSFGRLSSGAVNTIGTNGAGAGGGASGNNAGSGMAQSQIGYGGVLLSPAPVTAGPDLGGTARRFENFDRFPKASTPVTATPPRPSTSDSNKDISPPTTSAGGASSGSSGSGSANVRHSFTGENMGLQSHFANLTLNTNVNGNGSPNSIPYHGGQMKHTPPPLTAGPVPSTSSAVAQAILHGRSGSDGSSGANLGSLSGMGGVGLGGLSLNMNMINGTPAANAGATGGNAGINGNSGSSAWGNSNKFLSRGALSALPGGPSVVPPWATGNSGSNSGNGGSK